MNGRIGLIRVLTTNDPDLLEAHGRIIGARFPGIQVRSQCIPDQPEGIHDDRTEEVAIPKILAAGIELAGEGSRAIIVSCAADPAVGRLREILPVPVIGAGSAAACVALACGRRIGVLGIRDEAPAALGIILGRHMTALSRPEGIRTTLDLLAPGVEERVLAAAVELKQRGADAIVMGCTGYSTIGVAGAIKSRTGLPVADPVQAAGLIAWHAMQTG